MRFGTPCIPIITSSGKVARRCGKSPFESGVIHSDSAGGNRRPGVSFREDWSQHSSPSSPTRRCLVAHQQPWDRVRISIARQTLLKLAMPLFQAPLLQKRGRRGRGREIGRTTAKNKAVLRRIRYVCKVALLHTPRSTTCIGLAADRAIRHNTCIPSPW